MYLGTDRIVDRICAKLAEVEPESYDHVTKQRTGSSYSGLKVGLPHEVDYLLVVTDDLLSCRDFQKHMRRLFRQGDLLGNEAERDTRFVLHGIENHKVGVCLVMEYRPEDGAAEGITVDLVPVLKVPARRTATFELTRNAQFYLEQRCEFYQDENHKWEDDIYILAGSAVTSNAANVFDTGLLESNILKSLDPDTKRGLRVAKYLIQQYVTKDYAPHDDLVGKERALQLYGYALEIRSHFLRHCFLHLLMRVVIGDQPEITTKLKGGGVLALCLLDMMRTMFEHKARNVVTELHFTHPVNRYGSSVFHCVTYGDGYIDSIVTPFLRHAKVDQSVDMYTLLNVNRAPLEEGAQGDQHPKYAVNTHAQDMDEEIHTRFAEVRRQVQAHDNYRNQALERAEERHKKAVERVERESSSCCMRIVDCLICYPGYMKEFQNFGEHFERPLDENSPMLP